MTVIINFDDPQRNFIIQWSGAIVGGHVIVNGYDVDISGPDDGCRDHNVPQFTATELYQYHCPMPSADETYIFRVSGVCGTIVGNAVMATVTLQGVL